MGTALIDQKNLHFVLQMLEPKEQIYLEARLNGSPPVAAARVAGYKEPEFQAQRLESDERMHTAIKYSLRVRVNELQFTRDDVIRGLYEAVQNAATATEQVMAWREIAKILGHYAPTKHQFDIAKKEQLERLGDEELAEMAAIDADFVELKDE